MNHHSKPIHVAPNRPPVSGPPLPDQDEHHRYLVELNPQVPWVADRTGRLLDFSSRWLEITGLTREQALSDGWTEVPHPDDLPAMLETWTRCLMTGTPFDLQHRIRIADGSYRWMRTRAFPRKDDRGETVYWYGFTEDIDERIQAERALQLSEQRYRSIVENVREGVWMVDADYRITCVNARLAEMLGYSPHELLTCRIADIIAEPDEWTPCEWRPERLPEQQRSKHECRYRRKDGSDLWALVSVGPLIDDTGCFTGAVALLTDITDEKRLGTEQARLAAIVNSSEDAIVSKDLNGIVTSWNAAAERIYGWKADEIIGKSKGLVIPPELPDELPSILRQIRAGERIEHYETLRKRKDGTIIDVAISVSPLKDAQGRIIGAATIVRDITERRRTERELQRKQAEVEALNQRLTRAMQETHHRVKNNLQIVGAIIDMQTLEHHTTQTVPLEELVRLGHHIHTLAIVHDLLTQNVREDEHEQLLSSVEVLGQLTALLKETSGSRPLHAVVDDVQLVSKQAVTLALIVNELVSNAIKHGTGRVEVTFRVRDTAAELCVCDEGAGFPDRFNPAAEAHTGLELVLGLVHTDLKGHLRFENREGGGACVRTLFPLPARSETDPSAVDRLESPEP